MSRLDRPAARFAVAAVAAAVGLAIGEAGLRAYFWTKGVGRSDVDQLLIRSQNAPATALDATSVFGLVQPSQHPDVIYEIKPNARGRFRGQPIATNSFGMRGPEITVAKPEGTYRVIGLGDSHMFGWGVAQDETYLAVAERLLNREAPENLRFELLNFGVPGYNTAMEVAAYERKARHFEPDLIVMHFVGNDLGWPHHLQPPRSARPSEWFLFELARGVFGKKGLDGELELLPHDMTEVDEQVREAAEDRYRHTIGRAGYERAMARLAELTSEPRVPVIVASWGERELVNDVAPGLGFEILDFAPGCRRKMERAGIEITMQSWRETLLLPGDHHPSAFAHEAYAETLAEAIRARALAGS